MSKIEHSIDVNVPVREAYDQWTQFEEFPRFMDGVEQVQPARRHAPPLGGDDRRPAQGVGRRDHPAGARPARSRGQSTDGDWNAGAVDFHRLDDDQDPRHADDGHRAGRARSRRSATALGIPTGQVKGDLERFKEFIESRGAATRRLARPRSSRTTSPGRVARARRPAASASSRCGGDGHDGLEPGPRLGLRDGLLAGPTPAPSRAACPATRATSTPDLDLDRNHPDRRDGHRHRLHPRTLGTTRRENDSSF